MTILLCTRSESPVNTLQRTIILHFSVSRQDFTDRIIIIIELFPLYEIFIIVSLESIARHSPQQPKSYNTRS